MLFNIRIEFIDGKRRIISNGTRKKFLTTKRYICFTISPEKNAQQTSMGTGIYFFFFESRNSKITLPPVRYGRVVRTRYESVQSYDWGGGPACVHEPWDCWKDGSGKEPNDVGGRSTYPSSCTVCTGRGGEPANFSGVVTTCGKMAAAAAAATGAAQRPQNFVACRHGNDLAAAAQPRSPQPLPPVHRSGKSHTYPSAADPRGSPAKSLSTGGTHIRAGAGALSPSPPHVHPHTHTPMARAKLCVSRTGCCSRHPRSVIARLHRPAAVKRDRDAGEGCKEDIFPP